MALLSADKAFLELRGHAHEVHDEAGMTCVVLPSWNLPSGLDRPAATLLVRLPAGYPDVPPDMWWFDPGLRRADGRAIEATQATEAHLGRQWQRWSRHFQPGQWKSGVDGLESYLALIQRELLKAAA
jgi:Prokaryotic E2 family E